MAGLVPAIHVLRVKTWMLGIKPGMTPVSAGQCCLHGFNGSIGFRAVRAASLRHIGPTATLSTEHFSTLAHQIDC
jgi:hypothetical protein